ncbi:hypothetical protein D6764_03555 [Candidatus Woesearchaeota archaeon]|nr:MAG: hypothetical protein D6764_03555 [Candidatus Woesearchaeota archaeon]
MERKKKLAEITGKHIRVLASDNKELVGMKGKVVKETKNMIVLRTEEGIKKLIKSQITFEMDGKKYEGKEMIGKFVDRIAGA